MRIRARWVAASFAALAAAWLASGFVALAWLRQREQRRIEPLPSELAGVAEELRLGTRDGEELGAWFLDATRAGAPSVIELHGNGGGRRARLGAAQVVRERGCAVLLVTLRAHGDSTGERRSFGWCEREDVIAAVDWLEHRRPGAPILIHGASLGAAAAVLAADELGDRVSGYALECLYTDLDSAARRRCDLEFPPPVALAAYGALRAAAAIAWPAWKRNRPIDSLAAIPPSAPVLLLAGSDDREAPIEEQRALFERIREHAELAVLDGARHDRLQSAQPDKYRRDVLAWLDRCEPRGSGSEPQAK
jgi:alpha-beta hydrolase superfamily lysophospholipase